MGTTGNDSTAGAPRPADTEVRRARRSWPATYKLKVLAEIDAYRDLHKPRRYNRPLRHALYLSAQASMMRAGPNRDYYLKKRDQGRTHSQAVIALARRRIDVLWALLRDNRTWTPAPPATAQAA